MQNEDDIYTRKHKQFSLHTQTYILLSSIIFSLDAVLIFYFSQSEIRFFSLGIYTVFSFFILHTPIGFHERVFESLLLLYFFIVQIHVGMCLLFISELWPIGIFMTYLSAILSFIACLSAMQHINEAQVSAEKSHLLISSE